MLKEKKYTYETIKGIIKNEKGSENRKVLSFTFIFLFNSSRYSNLSLKILLSPCRGAWTHTFPSLK